MNKLSFLIAGFVFALPHTAYADEAQGKVVSVDEDSQTLKLDNGATYKLPGEFDYSILHKDMNIIVVYDVEGNDKIVTDVENAE
jgi:hypothetical protein